MSTMQMKKLGLIVNPIAGMGGRVGLKGTDGIDIVEKARVLGALPEAPSRAVKALTVLSDMKDKIQIITYPGDMGENEARTCGFNPAVIGAIGDRLTDSRDTMEAAAKLLEQGADLLLFAGGDGTARDIYSAIGQRLPVVGIPAGVKIHSAVYANNPIKAGELAHLYLQGKTSRIKEAEVMDIDEEAFRKGFVTARLYGYLNVPYEKKYLQSLKSGSPIAEAAAQGAIALDVIDNMEEDVLYIIGPGSTTRPIMEKLELQYTLLGVDVVCNKKLIKLDVTEKELLELVSGRRSKLVITPIGGQGYLFGRGNQQISPRVITQLGKDNIIVVATKQKISSLGGRPFAVDTGSSEADNLLCGYIKVTTGYKERIIYKIEQ